MQQPHIVDEIKKKYPWVDIVFGTHNIHRFPQLLKPFIWKSTVSSRLLKTAIR